MADSHHITLAEESSYLRENWTLFGIGCLIIILRFSVRLRTVGIKQFGGDDILALICLGLYTADAILVDLVYYAGTNVDVPADVVDVLTDSEIAKISWGSKCELGAWYTYTALIWCMKFMLLFFYRRLTMGTFRGKLINYLFWICGLTYIAIFLVITLGCYPIEQNWQVRPLPPKKCTFKAQNLYVGAVLNVLTDGLMLAIPVPMLWKLQVPLSKKLAIGAVLSSGLFVISAAIVRAALTLGATPSGLNVNRWGVRETFVGILTVNLPVLRPMFNHNFWTTGVYHPQSSGHNGTSWNSRRGGKSQGTFELHSTAKFDDSRQDVAGDHASVGSQENIIKKTSNDLSRGIVMVRQTYDVESNHRDEEDAMRNWDKAVKKTAYNTNISATPHMQ